MLYSGQIFSQWSEVRGGGVVGGYNLVIGRMPLTKSPPTMSPLGLLRSLLLRLTCSDYGLQILKKKSSPWFLIFFMGFYTGGLLSEGFCPGFFFRGGFWHRFYSLRVLESLSYLMCSTVLVIVAIENSFLSCVCWGVFPDVPKYCFSRHFH